MNGIQILQIYHKVMPNRKCLLSFTLIILLLLNVNSDDINNQQAIQQAESLLDQNMEPIRTTLYKQMYHKPINVSIGQQLSIVLPSFDSLYNSHNFQFSYLSDQQYLQTLNQLQHLNADNQNQDFDKEKEKEQGKNNQTSEKQQQSIGTPVLQSDLPLNCNYVPPTAKVYEVISKIRDQTGYNRANFLNKLYTLASSRQLLYILNTQNMLLSAYYYNDINIKFLSSYQLPTNKDPNQFQQNTQSYTQLHSGVSMTLNSKQTELYIFSIQGIWIIQTKTFLTNIKQVSSISGFQISEIGGLDKVIRGGGSYFVGMQKMGKVFIIPEPSAIDKSVYTQVTTFYDERIFPQDIAVHSSYLFVLDVYKGVYIYKISGEGKARQVFKIELQNYGGNLRIHLYQASTLFVNFNDFDGGKVVEINVDLENKKASLVRYFKNQDYISYLQTYNVLTSSTGYYLNQISLSNQIDIRHIRNSAETLLFMVTNFQEIQIFPFNVDPRTINLLQNGVKIYYPKVKEVYHIFEDRFLIITEDTIDYVKISIEKPQVNCMLGSKYNKNYKIQPENLKITVKSNLSTCEFRNKLFRHKVHYNQNCELITEYLVHINYPQKSSLRKLITYGIVLLVVVAFILGLFCLIQWREQKLVVLSRLKDEILRFRNRHRKMQPFVEEQISERKQVEMQVPKDIEFIPQE